MSPTWRGALAPGRGRGLIASDKAGNDLALQTISNKIALVLGSQEHQCDDANHLQGADFHLRRDRMAKLTKHLIDSASDAISGPAVLGIAVVLLFVGFPAFAANDWSSTLSREGADQKLDETRKTLKKIKRREKKISADVKAIAVARARINAQLIDTAKRVQAGESRLSDIEGRLIELDAQRKLISGSLVRQHRSLGKLLSALQRIGRNPPPVMATRRRDALQMVRSAMLLSSLFPELRDKAKVLSDQLEDLDRVVAEIRTQGEQLRQQNKLLAAAQSRLDGLMDTKQSRLSESQKELVKIRRIAAAQAKSVRNLGELITRLDKTVRENSTLGSYENDLAAGRAPGQEVAVLRPPKPSAAKRPTSENPQRTVELVPTSRAIAPRRAERLKPSRPFSQAKGRLPLPASGQRIFGFKGKTRLGATSQGIAIETRSRAQITSPNDGWVVYAGPFRSYRQLLIINAGGGYHVLMAGMERINVTTGQFVLAGEPVGKMSAKARASSSRSQDDAPILYIEFRLKGRPIDPDPWWAKGSAKVQG